MENSTLSPRKRLLQPVEKSVDGCGKKHGKDDTEKLIKEKVVCFFLGGTLPCFFILKGNGRFDLWRLKRFRKGIQKTGPVTLSIIISYLPRRLITIFFGGEFIPLHGFFFAGLFFWRELFFFWLE